MGHVVNQDTLRSGRVKARVGALRDVVEGTGISSSYIGQKVNEVMEEYVNQKYSRFQEYRADEYALKIVLECGLDPECIARFLDKFVELFESDDSWTIDKLFSSHPDSKNRAARIRKLIKKQVTD